jgi:hypothetical protein
MSGCDMAVRSRTIGMVRGAGVPSGGGVVVMGIIGITMLHPQEMGKPELSPFARGCVTLVSEFLEDSVQ